MEAALSLSYWIFLQVKPGLDEGQSEPGIELVVHRLLLPSPRQQFVVSTFYVVSVGKRQSFSQVFSFKLKHKDTESKVRFCRSIKWFWFLVKNWSENQF